MMGTDKRRLGETLIDAGVITQDQLDNALALQKKRQLRLGTILLQEQFVSEPQLIQALSHQLSIPWVSLWHIDIPDSLLEMVPANLAEEFFLVPIYVRTSSDGEKTLYVAMNDPTDDSALRFVSATAGMTVRSMIAGPSDISAAIQAYYYGEEEGDEEESYNPFTIPPPSMSSIPPPPGNKPPPPPPLSNKNEPEELSADDVEELEETEVPEATEENEAPVLSDDEKQKFQRQAEKHMFGVGRETPPKRLSLTLLDGTTIDFGRGAKPNTDGTFSKDDLIEALRASASGSPVSNMMPSIHWEDHMAALLEILFRKHLVQFEEYLEELQND